MRNFFIYPYTIWGVFFLTLGFLAITPLLAISLIHRRLYILAHYAFKLWGVTTFFSIGIPIKIHRRWKINPQESYVYCANHTSYMDIPTLFLTIPGFFSIIGKSELNKAPLFGSIFKRVYVSVDRKTKKGRAQAFEDTLNMLRSGRSMVFYPEGTIPKHDHAPDMISFKDGAFNAAITLGLKIVPVTLPYNWIILGDKGSKTRLKWRICHTIFHEPIDTSLPENQDVNELKQRVFNIMDTEIKSRNDEN